MAGGLSRPLPTLLHPGSRPARQLKPGLTESVYDRPIIGAGVMGLFTADFARRRGARVLLLDEWRLGDPRAASFSLTRSIRNDYLDPVYARLAFEARKLWLDFQRETGESFLIECGCLNLAKSSITPELSATYAEQSYRVLQGLHLKTEVFDRDGLRARFPQLDVDLGRLDVEAGFLHVPPITAALLARLRAADEAAGPSHSPQPLNPRPGRAGDLS